MMKLKPKIIFIISAVVFILLLALFLRKGSDGNNKQTTLITPSVGDVAITVSTTGVVEPQNRLEIKPSISGRIESMLVQEGDLVKEGEILAWMSSTERAALIDAARSQDEATLRYWDEAYKKTPIISPINGEVIVRAVEPGQTVTTTEPILVLSDRLVVSAQFDETDIAKIKVGQKTFITLDAYPSIKIDGTVDHIAYESEIVNNVTIYNVDILPKNVPDIMRSGMSVTVEVIEKEKDNVITLPASAIHFDGDRQFVLLKENNDKLIERDIKLGLNNDKVAEIISGVTAEDRIVADAKTEYLPQKKNLGTNPFMPQRRNNDRNR